MLCAPQGRELLPKLLPIGREIGAFGDVGAVAPDNLAVSAGHQRGAGVLIKPVGFALMSLVSLGFGRVGRVVPSPNGDAREPHAAGAIDRSIVSNLMHGVLGVHVVAPAAGFAIAGMVAIVEAEAKRIGRRGSARRDRCAHEQRCHRDVLLRVTERMPGVAAPHEAGVRLLARRLGDVINIERVGVGLAERVISTADAGAGQLARGRDDCQCARREYLLRRSQAARARRPDGVERLRQIRSKRRSSRGRFVFTPGSLVDERLIRRAKPPSSRVFTMPCAAQGKHGAGVLRMLRSRDNGLQMRAAARFCRTIERSAC